MDFLRKLFHLKKKLITEFRIDTVDFVVIPKETTSDEKRNRTDKRFLKKKEEITEFRIDTVDYMVIPKEDETEMSNQTCVFVEPHPKLKSILRSPSRPRGHKKTVTFNI
ncbi:uncharacterized protein LOC129968343 [Argiope bruennichi]|uniref:uncharacterized protein LOC129968343 n=1 Tax=Argiope bruennichi TaxID=94029 RepID=UPI002494E377|nr:uncharacterized protein LOC129968343 [Argiope bruennichi]